MKKWYLLMNDYAQKDCFISVQGVTDTQITYPVKPSYTPFPFYLSNNSCPDVIYYNLFRPAEIIFDFYSAQCWQVSINFWNLFSSFHMVNFHEKELYFTFEGNKVTTNKSYKIIYFPFSNVDFIDYPNSIFFPPKRGKKIEDEQLIPKKLILNDYASAYDLVVLDRSTIYSGMIAITEKVKNILETQGKSLKGYKIVPIDEALTHYCQDFYFDIEEHLRKESVVLPK